MYRIVCHVSLGCYMGKNVVVNKINYICIYMYMYMYMYVFI